MTKMPTYDADEETRRAYLARIAIAYEVPKTLIRYEQNNNTDRGKHTTDRQR